MSMAESKMPARAWLRPCGGGTRFPGHQSYVTVTGDSIVTEGRTVYIRADLVESLVEALRASQAALTMMTAPKSIMATSTAQAYAHAYAAECKARAALSSSRSDQQ